MYSQRISQINKKHKQEVERLTQEMNALNDCLQELEAEQSKERGLKLSSFGLFGYSQPLGWRPPVYYGLIIYCIAK